MRIKFPINYKLAYIFIVDCSIRIDFDCLNGNIYHLLCFVWKTIRKKTIYCLFAWVSNPRQRVSDMESLKSSTINLSRIEDDLDFPDKGLCSIKETYMRINVKSRILFIISFLFQYLLSHIKKMREKYDALWKVFEGIKIFKLFIYIFYNKHFFLASESLKIVSR